jgi:hypothetical protein
VWEQWALYDDVISNDSNRSLPISWKKAITWKDQDNTSCCRPAPRFKGNTLTLRKKAENAALVKQRSVAQSVHLKFFGWRNKLGGSRAAITRGSSIAATWLQTWWGPRLYYKIKLTIFTNAPKNKHIMVEHVLQHKRTMTRRVWTLKVTKQQQEKTDILWIRQLPIKGPTHCSSSNLKPYRNEWLPFRPVHLRRDWVCIK